MQESVIRINELAGEPASPGITTLDRIFQAQKEAFSRNPMPGVQERKDNLRRLKQALIANQETIISAVHEDFSCRSRDETLLAEIFPGVEGIRYAERHLKKWMKPSRRHVSMLFQPAKAKVIYQPMGVVGVIVPWNYPLYLSVGPLTGALAAGNRVMIKMSRNTPKLGKVFKGLIQETFPEDLVAVITGEDGMGSAFAGKPWDHLVFTGSTFTGRRIMRAASDNLTPVTLELGGKSPAIISQSVPMEDAAERIAFGKQFNVGQTCVAPDYVLCPENRIDSFVAAFQKSVSAMYPRMDKNPQYTSIINPKEHERLKALIADAEKKGARVIKINPANESFDQSRKLPIHLLLQVTEDMDVMRNEIFGPLLPVIPYNTLKDALAYVNQRPRPLALYYFDYEKANVDYVLTHTHSGGAVINDTLIHVAMDDLPFGGVGESGMGQYHSREGFLTFSKAKGVLIKPRFNSGKLIYPPYGRLIHKFIYKLFLS
ncbi:MAG: coniferyl aldehyde dehydrogenase [Desulfobacteraceae bacterium]|nr:MAG: coniferyl aldehyde dehydrogenase [Desulfobacteraceae bacterium]